MEVAAAVSLAAVPPLANFCRRTTNPPWAITRAATEARTNVLFQPSSETFAPSQEASASHSTLQREKRAPSPPALMDPDSALWELAERAMETFAFSPKELLEEAATRLLGTHRRQPRDLPLWALAEGLRRLLDTLDFDGKPEQPSAGPSRFTKREFSALARALLERAGIVPSPMPVRPGEELLSALPLVSQPLPAWLCGSLWASNVAGRAMINALGLTSTFIPVKGFGTFHVFDSHPPAKSNTPGAGANTSASSGAPTTSLPLLVVHGMFTNGNSMGVLAAALSDLPLLGHNEESGGGGGGLEGGGARGDRRNGQRRVLVPDLLGSDFGCSLPEDAAARRPSPLSTIGWHVASLAALLNALGVSTVDVLGHSYGGFVAQELCAALPAWRVRRVVLLCPGGGNRYRAGQSLRTIMGAGLDPTMELFEHSVRYRPLRRAVASIFRLLARTPTQATLLLDLFDARKYFFRFHDLSRKPVLLLWGTEDKVLEPRDAAVQWKHMAGHPCSRAFWVHGSSHVITFDAVATTYAATRAFLNESGGCGDALEAAERENMGWVARALWGVPAFHRDLSPMLRTEAAAQDDDHCGGNGARDPPPHHLLASRL